MNFSKALTVLAGTAGTVVDAQLPQQTASSDIVTDFKKNKRIRLGSRRDAGNSGAHSFRGIKKRYVPEDPTIKVIAGDIGVLPSRRQKKQNELTSERLLQGSPTCDPGFVECDGGFAVIDGIKSTTTCHAACDGRCCDSSNSCAGFTGKVCMDGLSCMGNSACFNANIHFVVNSCAGMYACRWNQMRNTVSNSCQGYLACRNAGRGSDAFGDVFDSCQGTYSCYDFGSSSGSSVGTVQSSCVGDYSCMGAGQGSLSMSTIGDMSGSCVGPDACIYMAARGGTMGNMDGACVGHRPCYGLANYAGSVGNMRNSCSGSRACNNFGKGGGSTCVGDIIDSCKAEKSCFNALYYVDTTGPFDNCCNSVEECVGVTSQPPQCESLLLPLVCGPSLNEDPDTAEPTDAPVTSEPTTTVPTTSPPSTAPTDEPTPDPPLVKAGNNGIPLDAFPLGRCEGDCDNDNECKDDLVCFTRDEFESVPGCSGRGRSGRDYCTVRPSQNYLAYKGEKKMNPEVFPLNICEGDCDRDSHCGKGLKCHRRKRFEPVPGCDGKGMRGKDYCIPK